MTGNNSPEAAGRPGVPADLGLVTALELALHFTKPILVEGKPGVGKTEIAHVLSRLFGRPLIRLQCYDGIDAAQALYEWNYSKKLLALRAAEGTVLLIDEIDRADAEFEAYLLEFLADFQIAVPKLETIGASVSPTVVLTSNRTRELHDALTRRCLYDWIDFPELERERRILERRVPCPVPRPRMLWWPLSPKSAVYHSGSPACSTRAGGFTR
jgi:MoxR-like ATPase